MSIVFPQTGWANGKYPWQKMHQVNSYVMYLSEQQDEDNVNSFNGRMFIYAYPYGSSGRNFGNISSLHNGGANVLFIGGHVKRQAYTDLINRNWNGWEGY